MIIDDLCMQFATNAKRIKNKPVLNEVMSDGALLKRYKTEMHQLRRQLDEVRVTCTAIIEIILCMLGTEYSGLYGQCHGCWCSGDLSRQDISRNDIDSKG